MMKESKPMMSDFELSLVAARPALLAGDANTVNILIRVQAPDAPKTGLPERPRLNLALVIDRSGSMAGRPLHEAKRAASFIVESLKATDRASVIAYDNEIKTVAASQPVTDKAHLKALIAQIESRGNTNLHGGWLKGAEETANHLATGFTSRVLLLSDGQANEGLTDTDEIATQCSKLADKGVSTSTYGLGESFNEELMVAMARSGRGRGYYSESAESLIERFQEEFALLSSLCARNVRLHLAPMPGVRAEMLNDYETAPDGSWRLPDLAYDGEAWAAVRLRVSGGSMPATGDALNLLKASVVYRDLDEAECHLPEAMLALPVKTAQEYLETSEDESVLRRISEAEAAKIQEQASRAARHGDWEKVNQALEETKVMAMHSPWLGEVVASLEGIAAQRDEVLYAKEAVYASQNLSNQIRSKRETARISDDIAEPMFLRRMARQGRSSQSGEPAKPKEK